MLALPSSEAECPSWQLQSSLLAAEAVTDTWHTSESSDLFPAHPVVFTDDKLGILESNTAMQPAVLEQAVTKSAMLATKLPEPALPASNIEMTPQQNSSFVLIELVNISSIALPLAPAVYQKRGTEYVVDRLQPRGKQLLLNYQLSPVAAESTAFFTLGSIAAFGSSCLTACAALLQSAWSHCVFAFRYEQSCPHFSMYLQQPHCSLSVHRLCTTCCLCCRDVVRMMSAPDSTAILLGAIAMGMVLLQMSFI